VPPIALVGDMEKLKSFQGDVRTLWEHLGPDSIGARYRLADLLEEMPGRESEVRKALTEIVRLDSSQARAVFRLARLAARQGNQEAADSLVSRYVKVETDPVKAAMGAGRVYERMGRTEEARETYRGLLRAHPEARQALDRLVATWLRAGDPEGARRELDQWSGDETSPLAAEARLLAGDTWAWTGDLDRALSTWREAEMAAGRQGLSDVRASALEGALSVDWVRDTTRGRSPVNPTIWTLIGLGRGEQARNLVEASRRLEVGEADRIDPITYHTLLYAWARSMELLGQEQAAASAYRELLDDWGDVVASLPRFADAPERLRALRS
jgi:tetratricopeptide (TPR) repeat protein